MGNNPGRITMFLDNVVEYLKIQGTSWAIMLGIGLLAWIGFRIVIGAERVLKRIPVPTVQWPILRLLRIEWERVSEPIKKVAMKTLVIVAVAVVGVAAPLYLALLLAQVRVVVDPVAYVASGAILSAIVVSMAGLVLLVKPDVRTSVSENGLLNTLVLYIIAISWLALVIAILPLILASG